MDTYEIKLYQMLMNQGKVNNAKEIISNMWNRIWRTT